MPFFKSVLAYQFLRNGNVSGIEMVFKILKMRPGNIYKSTKTTNVSINSNIFAHHVTSVYDFNMVQIFTSQERAHRSGLTAEEDLHPLQRKAAGWLQTSW